MILEAGVIESAVDLEKGFTNRFLGEGACGVQAGRVPDVGSGDTSAGAALPGRRPRSH